MPTAEDAIFFYLISVDGEHVPVHKDALVFPGDKAHLEIWQAPKNKKWHWFVQDHQVHSYWQDPGDGFPDAKTAMEAALDNEEVIATVSSWLDGERLVEIAKWAQEKCERNKARGL